MNQSDCKHESHQRPCTTHRADSIPFTHSPYPLHSFALWSVENVERT